MNDSWKIIVYRRHPLFVFIKKFQILKRVYVLFFVLLFFSDIVGEQFEWAELLCQFGCFAMADFGKKQLVENKVLLEER